MTTALDSWIAWDRLDDQEVIAGLARLSGRHARGADMTSARHAKLPFYARHRLIELQFADPGGIQYVFGLDSPDRTWWLDGSSDAIHATNADESLELTDENVLGYVRFFFFFVRGEGAFVLIESPDEVKPATDRPAAEEPEGRLRELRSRVSGLVQRADDKQGGWAVSCSVAYQDALFGATLHVSPSGLVEMVDDDPIGELTGISTPAYPALDRVPEPANGDHPRAVGGRRRKRGRGAQPPDREPQLGVDTAQAGELAGDRDVTEAVVAVLLEAAIRTRDASTDAGNTLLRHFNAETGSDRPIDRLRRAVTNSNPVIIIESDIPFVEDFVAGVIDGPDSAVWGGEITRADALQGDELRCVVEYASRTRVHLLSFHAYRGLFDAERTAHELALRDVTVLIGCERASAVPEPLQRITDLVLSFPRIDRRRFARIFEQVFGAKPAPQWRSRGADWTRYLVPADFHMPRRLGLNADQALDDLRERVEGRIRRVTFDSGPRLNQLYGLGEAREICEDLVADIKAAQSGEIPWTAVDRGLLLVGAPGTGKTTLARALAAECGIKFVLSSAASWQAAGALDAHLRAMREDFSEARRYAPAILFLDEIDSIGSREQLGGDRNVVYQTDVINALLEEIQGMDVVDPVIVVAATNYPDRVDPALRRAGRLDQVVQLPLPNVPGLERIFDYYLAPLRAEKAVARKLDLHALAELSIGATGADVEFFVRGAARRARRARRKIGQEDLVAEITRRPRRPDSAPQLGRDDMRRVAVHEAGHAVARLISSTRGSDITFLTIMPRLDGSLGFVARAPQSGQVATRKTMLEELETILAGRAAEEVIFGSDEIGTGAGGPSAASDLAVATRTATQLVCQSGLGDDAALRWTEHPTPAQDEQIDALLTKAYTGILMQLEGQRALLDRIVAILEDKQELSGAELRRMLAHGAEPAEHA